MISTQFVLLSGLALAVSVGAVTAPPVTSVQLQITQPNNNFVGCLAAGSEDDNTPVTIVNCNSTFPGTHAWSVVKGGAASGTGPASQIRVFGNKCLDLTNGVTTNGNKLQIFTCTDGNTNQLWNVNSDTSIRLAGTSKCVDLTNGVLQPGTPAQIWDCTSGPNQKWTPAIAALPSAQLQFEGATTTSTLCITPASNANNAAVQIQPCSSTTFFQLPPSGYGQLKFQDKCIDVTNGVNADGTKLQIFDCFDGNTNQIFSFAPGTLTAISWVGTNKVFDLTGGVTTSGNPIQVWTATAGNTNQIWEESPSF